MLLAIANNKTNSEDEANLFGKRFAAVTEPGEGQRWDEAKLKRLVGVNGSRIRCRYLFQNSFEFDATHKLWLDTNHRPIIRGSDDATWNRLKVIPFENVIPKSEQDGTLRDKLQAEASGILNWMLEGLRMWRAEGLAKAEPPIIIQAGNSYRLDSDDLGQFLRATIRDNPAGRADKKRLYTAYRAWCQENGIEHPWAAAVLGRKLADRGYGSDAGKRFCLGMELLEMDAPTYSHAGEDDGGSPF